MEVLKRGSLAALLALAAGCSFLHEPTPVEALGDNPSVHAVLVTGTDTVQVLLQRVGGVPSFDQNPGFVRAITGADVRLSVGRDTVRLAESPAGFLPCQNRFYGAPDAPPGQAAGCYGVVLPGGVRAGEAYSLRIRLPGGETVEGTATALPQVAIRDPQPGRRISIRDYTQEQPLPVEVRLAGVERAAGAAVNFIPGAAYMGGRRVAGAVCSVEHPVEAEYGIAADGVVRVTVYAIRCVERTNANGTGDRPFAADSVRARLRVTAYDSAYVRYIVATREEAVVARDVRVGIEGALGLFAGAARAEQEVVLVPCIQGRSC